MALFAVQKYDFKQRHDECIGFKELFMYGFSIIKNQCIEL